MKVNFSIREKLYADVNFEIECENQEQVEDALDRINDCCDADEFYNQLTNIFGYENVKAEGLGSIDNIYPADECEFWDWEDSDEEQ